MTKKEFMAMSLPYKLPVISKHGNSIGYLTAVSEGTDFTFRTVCVVGREKEMKHIDNTLPIVRPLSDLTKEIEHKGEIFIPVEKLGWGSCFSKSNVEMAIDNLSLHEALKLIEWHFDIAGLTDKNEAVDYHTLEGFSF